MKASKLWTCSMVTLTVFQKKQTNKKTQMPCQFFFLGNTTWKKFWKYKYHIYSKISVK